MPPRAWHAQDPPAVPDETVADLKTGIVNGAVRHDFERKRRGIGKANVPKFVGRQSSNAFPGDQQRAAIILLDGATVVTQPNQRAKAMAGQSAGVTRSSSARESAGRLPSGRPSHQASCRTRYCSSSNYLVWIISANAPAVCAKDVSAKGSAVALGQFGQLFQVVSNMYSSRASDAPVFSRSHCAIRSCQDPRSLP